MPFIHRSLLAATLLAATAAARLDGQSAAPARPDSTPRPAPPTVTAGEDGFGFRSGDGAFTLRVRGGVQYDGRFFADDTAGAAVNTFQVRRARADFQGAVYSRYDYRLQIDVANSQMELLDAYVDARVTPALRVRAGKFRPPMGLQRLQATWVVLFAERAFPTALVPNRDVGLQVHGVLGGGALEYAAGIFNGVADGANQDVDASDAKDVVGRVFVHPFRATAGPLKGLGLGVAASTGNQRGSSAAPLLPSFRTPGREIFFRYRADGTAANTAIADGERTRLAPQGYWYWGPVGVLGEYTVSRQRVRRDATEAELKSTAWQVEGAYALTGEAESYRGITPPRPGPGGAGRGAVELVARAQQLTVDDDAFPLLADPARSMRAATSYGAGVNWYLNRAVRVLLSYEHTTFEAFGTAAARAAENAVIGRMQVAF